MSSPSNHVPARKKPALDQLLRRGDLWRGHSGHFTVQPGIDTGYAALNAALLNKGWPVQALVECCQPLSGVKRLHSHGEWPMLAPALRHIKQLPLYRHAHLVLLNPPALPLPAALLQWGIDVNSLLIVESHSVQDFIASFVAFVTHSACAVVMAWQPEAGLSYTQLRKCQLASAQGSGLCLLMRPLGATAHSSPAPLRLSLALQCRTLDIHIFKQKGALQHVELSMTLPESWLPCPPYLDCVQQGHEAQVLPLIKQGKSSGHRDA